MLLNQRTFFLLSGMIILLAYFLQDHLFISADVAYLLYLSEQLREGGHYVSDFFETNPPMILYLYMPAIFLTKIIPVESLLALRMIILLYAFFSIYMCYGLLKQISADKNFLWTWIFALFFTQLFLPLYELGQRESLFFILLCPYLFAATLSLDNKKIPSLIAILVGIFAGLGCGLKPFFIFPFIFIESFLMIKKRQLFFWMRTEVIVMGSVLIVYCFSVGILQPNYFNIILPLVFNFYFIGMEEHWVTLFSDLLVIYCLGMVVSYFIFYSEDKYPRLSVVIWLGLIGAIFSCLVTKTNWFYHLLPATALATLLLFHYVGQSLSQCKTVGAACFIMVALTLVALIPLSRMWQTSQQVNAIHESDRQLRHFVQGHPEVHSLICYTVTGTSDCFPMINVTKITYGGRFPFFWWYPGIYARARQTELLPNPILSEKITQGKTYFIHQVAEDLNKFHPDWVIVNNDYVSMLNANRYPGFIEEFSLIPSFNVAFQDYQLSYHVGHYFIYTKKAP